jgi:hypothetical protein
MMTVGGEVAGDTNPGQSPGGRRGDCCSVHATWQTMAKHGFRDTRFAALPWRISEGGRRQIMLLTTRETRRWIIPKGWP